MFKSALVIAAIAFGALAALAPQVHALTPCVG